MKVDPKKGKASQKNKKAKNKSESSESDVNSRDLSALGGGNMRNPSSSDPSESSDKSSSEPPSDKAKPNNDLKPNTTNLISTIDPKDGKRPSIQFLEKLNLTEVESLIDDKGLVPIYFGGEDKIIK